MIDGASCVAAALVVGLLGWVGGYFFGWVKGSDSGRRCSDAAPAAPNTNRSVDGGRPASATYPVYHRVQKKNRRGALRDCSGIAFRRSVRGPIPANEIPATCEACGQPLKAIHLDLGKLIDVRTEHRAPVTNPRHHGPKGTPIVETRKDPADGV